MPLTARVSSPTSPAYPLSFNEIKNTPGLFENTSGNVLFIASDAATYVAVPSTGNKKVTSTGFTRTGMVMFRKQSDGSWRPSHLACGPSPDGVKRWRRYTGKIELSN